MLTRNRDLAPAIPFICVHEAESFAVDVVPTAITWGHARYKTSDFHFNAGNTRITLKKDVDSSGIYMLYASAGAVKKAGNPLELILEIYINGVLYDCAEAHGMIGPGVEHSDVMLITALYLRGGDYVEVYVSVDAGTATIEDSTARLIIHALPMHGWNNKAAGNLRIRGEVLR